MKTKGMNQSLLALILATTSNIQAATSTVAEQNPASNSQSNIKTQTLKFKAPARYNHPEYGYINGTVILEIHESHITPIYLNGITSEYQGSFYFISNDKFKGYNYYQYIGGEDGNVILDLVNKPSKKDGDFVGKKYNLHGCNSTTTSCAPLANQITMFNDGTYIFQGFLEEIELFEDGVWTNRIFNSKLVIK